MTETETITDLERVERAMWAQRIKAARDKWPDLPPIDEWGDGTIPKLNGIEGEVRAALQSLMEPSEGAIRHTVEQTIDLNKGEDYEDAAFDFKVSLQAFLRHILEKGK